MQPGSPLQRFKAHISHKHFEPLPAVFHLYSLGNFEYLILEACLPIRIDGFQQVILPGIP